MKRKQIIELTLIFPVYNEQERLTYGIRTALKYLMRQTYRWEVIVVDDGSYIPAAETLAAENLLFVPNLDVIRLWPNCGKGRAIAQGVAKARGKYIVFSDIDLSVPIATISKLLHDLKNHELVLASRRAQGSRILTHQPWLRETSGRIFTWLANVICGLRVTDATCGFKGFRKAAAKRLFKKMKIDRWVFDVEILYLARKLGYSVKEMAVTWADRKGTKVRFTDFFFTFFDLLRIRLNDNVGN